VKFTEAPTDENYSEKKFVSETGQWEVGLWPAAFGVRVRAGRAGRGSCAIDYCAGAQRLFQLQLLGCIMDILESFPESVDMNTIENLMPGYKQKPIDQDPCWDKLRELSRRAIRGEVLA